MTLPHSKRKTSTITIRDLEEEQHGNSQWSYQEEHGDWEEQDDQLPLNKDFIVKMAEFINENPNFFEHLGRFFKRKEKEKAESSKRWPSRSIRKKIGFQAVEERAVWLIFKALLLKGMGYF